MHIYVYNIFTRCINIYVCTYKYMNKLLNLPPSLAPHPKCLFASENVLIPPLIVNLDNDYIIVHIYSYIYIYVYISISIHMNVHKYTYKCTQIYITNPS
jgi:hypothetical protein